jgi:hypothetical protein
VTAPLIAKQVPPSPDPDGQTLEIATEGERARAGDQGDPPTVSRSAGKYSFSIAYQSNVARQGSIGSPLQHRIAMRGSLAA